jgi:hypothetical protein
MIIGMAAGIMLAGGWGVWRMERPMKARAQSGCLVGSIQGSYGYQYTGFVFPSAGAPAMVPLADAGRVVLDGNGGYTGADTFSVNGLVVRSTQAGTYTVTPDCTGSSVAKDSLGNTIATDFVIVNGGAQIAVVYTQGGVSASALLNRQ